MAASDAKESASTQVALCTCGAHEHALSTLVVVCSLRDIAEAYWETGLNKLRQHRHEVTCCFTWIKRTQTRRLVRIERCARRLVKRRITERPILHYHR